MIGLFTFALGLAAGSFLNALVWRYHEGRSFVKARSQCTSCGHTLGFWDLIPLVSFVMLGGRCRYCSAKIGLQYPVVELSAALGLVIIAGLSLGGLERLWLGGLFLLALLIFVYDLKYLIIPDAFVAAGLVWLMIGLLGLGLDDWAGRLLTALGIFGFFAALYFLSRGRWIGGGDGKLGFLIGLWLGWPLGVLGVFLSYILGAVVGVLLIGLGKATLKSQIPFGPFMVAGAVLAYGWGEVVVDWYVSLF
ncbi:MAG: prepilin peptidase [Parcubacteria group bacterium]|nr:prepilin peptidase [Parcubacteria group bacterium]